MMHWLTLLGPIYQLLKLIAKGKPDAYLLKQAEEVLSHVPEAEVQAHRLCAEDILVIGKAIYDWARKGGKPKRKRGKK